MEIGYKLALFRKRAGLKQAEAADMLGISRSTLSLYENDKEQLPVSIFVKMADLYDFDVYDVLGVNDPSESTFTDEEARMLEDVHEKYFKRRAEKAMELMPEGSVVYGESL